MANKIIILAASIVGHTVVTQLEFREPKWDEIMDLGEPYIWAARGDGKYYATPMPERIKAYAERLIARGEERGDPLLLSRLGIIDTLKVRDAIMDFFLRVDPDVAGSTTSPKTSSSTANGTQTPSDA